MRTAIREIQVWIFISLFLQATGSVTRITSQIDRNNLRKRSWIKPKELTPSWLLGLDCRGGDNGQLDETGLEYSVEAQVDTDTDEFDENMKQEENTRAPTTPPHILMEKAKRFGEILQNSVIQRRLPPGSMDGLKRNFQLLSTQSKQFIKQSRKGGSMLNSVLQTQSNKAWDFLAPGFLGGLSLWPSRKFAMTFPIIFLLSLVGSSVGFHLFLYFISIGYGLAIFVPSFISLAAYNLVGRGHIPFLTHVYTGMVLLWSIRLTLYLWYREYIGWPQLHEKIVEVDQKTKMSAKVFFWISLSLIYSTMVMPCIYRLQDAIRSEGRVAPWGPVGFLGILIQMIGLGMETVADAQKSEFKSIPGNRNAWCHTPGLWSFSTHPNYLGEELFWIGTYLGGMGCYRNIHQWAIASLGILFISVVIKGAISSLGTRHLRKYSHIEEFREFRKTHRLWGPVPERWRISIQPVSQAEQKESEPVDGQVLEPAEHESKSESAS